MLPLRCQVLEGHRSPRIEYKIATKQLRLTRISPLACALMPCPAAVGLNITTWNKAHATFEKKAFVDKKAYMLKQVESGNSSDDNIRATCTAGVGALTTSQETASRNTGILFIRRRGDKLHLAIQILTQDGPMLNVQTR